MVRRFVVLTGMRKCRVIENCWRYHLISRLAHQAFFLDDGENTRAVEFRSSIHFNRYYLAPLISRGMIARTDPQHPKSPQQKYR